MIIDGDQFDDSGLMPKVDDEQFEWTRPDFAAEGDPIGALATWATDIAEQTHMVWPAQRDGRLVVPPIQHALDRMVRSRIAGESPEIEAELMLRPDPGTVGVVYGELPSCDFCARDGEERPARYDSTIQGRTAWANMCAAHYLEHSPLRLGLGEGQYLMTSDELPRSVHVAYERAMDYWAPWLSD